MTISANMNLKKTNLTPVEVPHFAGICKKNPTNKDTFEMVKETTKKGVQFTGDFFSSIYQDARGIAKEKSSKTIERIDSIV